MSQTEITWSDFQKNIQMLKDLGFAESGYFYQRGNKKISYQTVAQMYHSAFTKLVKDLIINV